MLDIETAEEIIAVPEMPGQTANGDPVSISVRVLTDGNEHVIEVKAGFDYTDMPEELVSSTIEPIYIGADGGLVAMLLSMSNMMPQADPTVDELDDARR